MKKEIHPKLFDVKVTCACGNNFDALSVSSKVEIEICSACHPFYTGSQKFVDTAGRIERFEQRYNKKNK